MVVLSNEQIDKEGNGALGHLCHGQVYCEDTQVQPEAILCGVSSLLDEYQTLVANQRTI